MSLHDTLRAPRDVKAYLRMGDIEQRPLAKASRLQRLVHVAASTPCHEVIVYLNFILYAFTNVDQWLDVMAALARLRETTHAMSSSNSARVACLLFSINDCSSEPLTRSRVPSAYPMPRRGSVHAMRSVRHQRVIIVSWP